MAHFADDERDEPRRRRSSSSKLNVPYESTGRPRSQSCNHDRLRPTLIKISNNVDAYREGPSRSKAPPHAPRGSMPYPAQPRHGHSYGFPSFSPVPPVMLHAPPGPGPVAPNMVIVPAGGGYYRPCRHHSHSLSSRSSRSRSRSHSHSRSRTPKSPYEEEEWRGRVIADAKRKDEEDRAAQKAAIEKYKADAQRKEEDEEAAKNAIIENYRTAKAAKEVEEEEADRAAVRRHETRLQEEEDEKKKAWEEYELKLQERKAKKKEEEEQRDEDYRERTRKHLAKIGYASNQIEAIIEMEKLKITNNTPGTLVVHPRSRSSGQVIPGVRTNVFPKIKRKDIALDTLHYYDLEWEYCHDDNDYIVILQEMTSQQTDVLFAHTARLREKDSALKVPVVVEERRSRGGEGELLLVRRRSKSGRSKSGTREQSRARERSQARGARFAASVLGL